MTYERVADVVVPTIEDVRDAWVAAIMRAMDITRRWQHFHDR